VAETDGDQGYTIAGNWSSFSTPVAAGVVGLLMQAAKQDAGLNLAVSPRGGNCVLKAIVMSSARKLPFWHKGRLSRDDDYEVPLDYAQGAGMIDAVRAHQLLKAGRARPGDVSAAGWDLNHLDAEQTLQQVYRLTVDEPAGKVLAATLVWNRHYSPTYPFKHMADRDSDLRLEVWGIDPENPGRTRWLDYSDSRVDNVEHVYVETKPEYSLYEIVVSHSNLDERKSAQAGERYALAWSLEEKLPDESIFWHDLNADGIVNEQDFAILMDNWTEGLKSPQAYVIGDVTKDGKIDVRDISKMIASRDRRAGWRTEGAVN
jgi:hypothetical protein